MTHPFFSQKVYTETFLSTIFFNPTQNNQKESP
jgi:hypothetical protein